MQFRLAALFRVMAWCGCVLALYGAFGLVGIVAIGPVVLWVVVAVKRALSQEYGQLIRLCVPVGLGAAIGLLVAGLSFVTSSVYAWRELPTLLMGFLVIGTYSGIVAGLVAVRLRRSGVAVGRGVATDYQTTEPLRLFRKPFR